MDEIIELYVEHTVENVNLEVTPEEVTIHVIEATGNFIPGPKGDTGDKGEKGDTGAQGIQGLKGDKGDTGATGAQGIQGLKGDKGDTGATGAQGIQGLKGDKGDTGATGATGAQGIQGLKGDTGATGATGAQGIQGLKGDTGATGATGAQGTQGLPGVGTIAKDTTNSATLTGTTNTILKSYAINGGTLSASDIIELMSCKIYKTGTAGALNVRVYINSSNSLTGATQIGLFSMTATLIYGKFRRSYPVNGGNLSYPSVGAVTGSDDANTSSTAVNNTVAFNVASTYFIIIAGQLSSASDSVYINEVKIIF